MNKIKCNNCEKEIIPTSKSSKFCSQDCYNEHRKTRGNIHHKHLLKGRCRTCNEPINVRRSYCPTCHQAFLDKSRKRYKMTTNTKCSHCGIEKTKENTFSPEEGIWSTKCRACCRKVGKKSEHDIKQRCVDYKGGRCFVCGYKKCLRALEFHHLDPSKKDFSISKKMAKELTVEVCEELDKCVLLCSNCHREEHYRLDNGMESLANKTTIIKNNEDLVNNIHWSLCSTTM